MINKRDKKPELLAPSGSIESFHAAIDAGADAIYLGLDDFNARLRAKNFTIKTLSYLVPYAHQHNVKIYVTVNIQIKQNELSKAIHFLYQLEQLSIDGIIIADPGLIQIARTAFPKLPLHGSTQMAIHNSIGVKKASQLGLKRIVLARELSLTQIEQIAKNSTIELETFVHGALCYSISGDCLASSILGGSSGNRGRCTQVCRRKFACKSSDGYFFSPKDFCGVNYLQNYAACNVSSLKIEGRMKGPEYVYTVVKAYRKALDDISFTDESIRELQYDLGRQKTSFFLDKPNESIIDPVLHPGTGLLAGTIISISNNRISIVSQLSIIQGDRIRIQPSTGFEGKSTNVISVLKNDTILEIEIKDTNGISVNDEVFIVSKKANYSRLDQTPKISSKALPYSEFYPRTQTILKKYSPPSEPINSRNQLWIKVDQIEWFDLLLSTPCQKLIFAGSIDQMNLLLNDEARIQKWRSRLLPSLPPFIAEDELSNWSHIIKSFHSKGIKQWVCTNIGQTILFPSDFELIADNPIWALNSATQHVLIDNGFKWFFYSIEDDFLNIKSMISDKGIVYLYGHIPLFISRIKPASAENERISDPLNNHFFASHKDNLHYLLTEKPFGIFQRKEKLISLGFHQFAIDCCFTNPDALLLHQLLDCYKNSSKMPQTELYNFKAGLK